MENTADLRGEDDKSHTVQGIVEKDKFFKFFKFFRFCFTVVGFFTNLIDARMTIALRNGVGAWKHRRKA